MTRDDALVHGRENGNGCERGNRFDGDVLVDGLRLLLTAGQCAADTSEDGWSFAVEIGHLHSAGLTDTLLRWLIVKGYVIHREETTLFGQPDRSFRDIGRLRFSPESCFVLTAGGWEFAEQICAVAGPGQSCVDCGDGRAVPETAVRKLSPFWDSQRKELWFDGLVVKRFRVQSPNQETVLMAFEEEQWPPRIDDPLPPAPNQCPKRRLHDTVKNLNRHHQHRLLTFHGDGTGEGVLWERIV